MSSHASTAAKAPKKAKPIAVPDTAQVVMATGNTHKVREVAEILRPLVPSLQPDGIVASGELGIPSPTENGTSFSANALIKARALAEYVKLPILADDSGLSVEILGGAPGIFSARWAGSHGDDQANLQLLLNQLSDVTDPHRGAAFVCAAVLLLPSGKTYLGNGVMGGRLTTKPRGKNGFGYDPIFVADAQNGTEMRTNAQLSAKDKNAISHRANAFRQIAPQLEAILERTPRNTLF